MKTFEMIISNNILQKKKTKKKEINLIQMKTFRMHRNSDSSQVSGTGYVLDGVIFPSGHVVVCWNSGTKINSLGIYHHFFDFYSIHISSHPDNKTELRFSEETLSPIKRDKTQTCRHCKNTYESHPTDKQGVVGIFRRTCSGNLVELI